LEAIAELVLFSVAYDGSKPQGIDDLRALASRGIMGDARAHPPPRKIVMRRAGKSITATFVSAGLASAGVPKDVEQWGWNCGFYPVFTAAAT
jgi:hypothetical protein